MLITHQERSKVSLSGLIVRNNPTPPIRLVWIIAVALILVNTRSLLVGEEATKKLNSNECAMLVIDALKPQGRGYPIRVSQMDFSKYDKEFIYFSAYVDAETSSVASPNLGSYAVNPWTGDVFNSDTCKRVESKMLKNSQSEIRTRFHFPTKEYRDFRQKKPVC
jgi:hypothetical protein